MFQMARTKTEIDVTRKSDERRKNGSKVLLSTIKVLDSVLSF